MSEVVSIFGDDIPPAGSPNPEVIRLLEELLVEAHAGRVTGLAYVALWPNRDFLTQWTHLPFAKNDLVAGTSYLFHRMGMATLADDQNKVLPDSAS